MERVEYRGYTAVQHHNKHMAIYNKGGTMVFHAQCAVEKSEAELKGDIDMYIDIFLNGGANNNNQKGEE